MKSFWQKYSVAAAGAGVLFLGQAGSALAQTGTAPDEKDVAVAHAVAEGLVGLARTAAVEQTWEHARIPGGTLALIAYFVLWIFIFAMIFLTLRRQRAVDGEVAELGRRMDVVFEDIEKS